MWPRPESLASPLFSLPAGFYLQKEHLTFVSGHYSQCSKAQFTNRPPLYTQRFRVYMKAAQKLITGQTQGRGSYKFLKLVQALKAGDSKVLTTRQSLNREWIRSHGTLASEKEQAGRGPQKGPLRQGSPPSRI